MHLYIFLYLEEGSNSPLDIDGILVVSWLNADDVVNFAIVEVDPDGLVDSFNLCVLLAFSADDLDVLQPQKLVALRQLGKKYYGLDFCNRLLTFRGWEWYVNTAFIVVLVSCSFRIFEDRRSYTIFKIGISYWNCFCTNGK